MGDIQNDKDIGVLVHTFYDKVQKDDRLGYIFNDYADVDWVAELKCGHNQHVRHDPPWQLRPWVISDAGRKSRLGHQLHCKKCDKKEPKDNT